MIHTEGLRCELDGHVAMVTIDRPRKRNALTSGMAAGLAALYDEFDRDIGVRVVLLTSASGPVFCAGMDIGELARADSADRVAAMPMGGTFRNLFEVMVECGKPTVVAVDGAAMGAGCELALASDIRILTPRSVLALPEAKIGMGANFGAQMLPRLVPRGIAYEHLYTAKPIDADLAYRIGLANHVVSEARSYAEALCRDIAANAPLTVRRYKQVITAGADLPLGVALRQRPIPDPYCSTDRIEGAAAYAEGRTARWRDR